jgi:putative peptidoglycan lipid II flippase
MAVTLASLILGFGREVVYAKFFGTSWQLDAFYSAVIVPTVLFGVFNGALISALVPIFSEYIATDREEEAWCLGTTLLVVTTVLLSVASVIGIWFAPLYVPLIAHFSPDHLAATIGLTRWLMPTIVATSLSGIVAAMLNAHQRFAAAAFQGVVLNIVVIATVIFGFGQYGVMSLVFGTLIGFCAQLAVQLPAFFAAGGFRFAVDLKHPGLKRVAEMLGPIAVGSAAGQLALFFDRSFASGLNEGSISAMAYATKIVGFPQQMFVTAIATVIFPIFASQFASRNRAAMRRSVATGLQMVVFLTLPSALGLIALAGPIVGTLFQRGAFTAEATAFCTSLLPYAAAGLVALAANVVLTRCIFACGEVRSPVAVSVLSVALNVILSVIWLPHLGARGLFLANTVSQTAQTLALGVIVWKLLGGFDLMSVGRSILKVAGCSAMMVAVLVAVQSFEPPVTGGEVARIVSLCEHLAFGAAVFLGLARLFDSEEVHLAIALLVRRQPPRDLMPLP